MLARPDAFHAAYAGIGVFDFDMAVAKEVDLAKHFPGAHAVAIPACHAVV